MTEEKPKLLIVEDDLGLQKQLKWCFDEHEVLIAATRTEAIAQLRRFEPPVVLQDLGLPPDPEGGGEGMEMYQVGGSRGCGGTGIWDGQKLHVGRNYKTWKILANGPVRTVFELSYEAWDAGGVKVSETKPHDDSESVNTLMTKSRSKVVCADLTCNGTSDVSLSVLSAADELSCSSNLRKFR
jgi:hypothetical protein